MGNINKDVVKNLIVKVITKEKEFLNEKGMTETPVSYTHLTLPTN